MDLATGGGHAEACSHSSSEDSVALPPREEARDAAFSHEVDNPVLQLSDSEGSEQFSLEAGEVQVDSPLHSPAQEELVDVLTRVATLSIEWPKQDRVEVQPVSRLDGRFFRIAGSATMPEN